MVALGYRIERIIWEICYGIVVLLSIIEICFAFTTHRRQIKTLQKVTLPCTLITGIIGMVSGIDLRGAFQIFTAIPDFPRICIELFGIVPAMTICHTWDMEVLV